MKEVYNEEFSINKALFNISIFVTVLAIGMMLTEFFSRGAFPATKIGVFYVGVLLIYSFHKEALRWISKTEDKEIIRRGEYFVYFWIISTAILYLVNFLTKDYFVIGSMGQELTALSEITFTALEVCAVFISARIFKIVFNLLDQKRK